MARRVLHPTAFKRHVLRALDVRHKDNKRSCAKAYSISPMSIREWLSAAADGRLDLTAAHDAEHVTKEQFKAALRNNTPREARRLMVGVAGGALPSL